MTVNLSYNKPSYLNDFPFRGWHTREYLPNHTLLITEYSDGVDVQALTQFFLDRVTYEDTVTIKSPQNATLPNATVLKETPYRTLFNLIFIYFEKKDAEQFKAFTNAKGAIYWDQRERNALLEWIPRFCKKEDRKPLDGENCWNYAFKKAGWYRESLRAKFLSNPNAGIKVKIGDVLEFLKKSYPVVVGPPKPDDIVIYVCKDEPCHYGRVVKVDNDGVIIKSRLGVEHINEHLLELVPYYYGNLALFVRKA